ncbi:MAG TPA: GtrA family protein, partial [Candidatus Contendobacter sp.]|nr:GtrA family protein [Candidatus Contendobacter sp.]
MFKQAAGPVGFDNPSSSSKLRFIPVSLLALTIDLVIFNLLHYQGFSLSFSHITSFLAASGIGYLLNSIWSRKKTTQLSIKQFIITTLLILFLRGGILASLIQSALLSLEVTIIFCVFISSICNYFGSIYSAYSPKSSYSESGLNPYSLAIILITYSVFLR